MNRTATEADREAIAETLARAFDSDPVWGWGFEAADHGRKLAALRAVFGFCAAAAIRYGWVRVTAGVEAVALWIPPGEPELPAAEAKRLPSLIEAACGPESAPRVNALMTAFERTHPSEPPHFYLSLLGTHPDHAGRGLGMGLLAANLEEIDAAEAPAYLESSNAANVPRYERHGFRPLSEVELIPGIPATQMWREPGGAAGGPA